VGQAASGMYQLRSGGIMAYVIKWVLCLTVAIMGIIIMIADPTHSKLGILLTFGGFLLFGLSLAQAHISTFE
jgi:hypothetical protein